uniref:Uncharacterized protein n=1 Tax=Arundo donax TaxID=35708 RepID=A0A0A9B2N6_ARUDO
MRARNYYYLLPRMNHLFYLPFYSLNIYAVVMACLKNVVPIVVLKHNNRYKQPNCHVNSFESYIRSYNMLNGSRN